MLQARYPSGWLSVRINFCSIDSKSGSRVRCSDCNYNSEDQTIRSTNHNSFIHISIDRTCCLSVEIRERLCQHTSPFESLQSSLDLILWRLRNGNCILNFVEWWIVHVTKYLTAILVQSHDPTQRVTSISAQDDYENCWQKSSICKPFLNWRYWVGIHKALPVLLHWYSTHQKKSKGVPVKVNLVVGDDFNFEQASTNSRKKLKVICLIIIIKPII